MKHTRSAPEPTDAGSGSAAGVLYVVATPIGNMEDFTTRARETLAAVDLVLAEDTRVTRRLLERCAIDARLMSLHAGNEAASTRRALECLGRGQQVAIVSDAGTPLLSDPGFELVRAAQAAGIAVRPVPGASALTAALSVCGLPTNRFWFEGFLPARGEARRRRLAEIADLDATLVMFEAPHRIRASLADMSAVLGGERRAAFARELTKLHEEIRSDTLQGLERWFDSTQARGEFVLLVEGASADGPGDARVLEVLRPLLEVLPLAQAVTLTTRLTGAKRNHAYRLALECRDRQRSDDDGD